MPVTDAAGLFPHECRLLYPAFSPHLCQMLYWMYSLHLCQALYPVYLRLEVKSSKHYLLMAAFPITVSNAFFQA